MPLIYHGLFSLTYSVFFDLTQGFPGNFVQQIPDQGVVKITGIRTGGQKVVAVQKQNITVSHGKDADRYS